MAGCQICGTALGPRQTKYCSNSCSAASKTVAAFHGQLRARMLETGQLPSSHDFPDGHIAVDPADQLRYADGQWFVRLPSGWHSMEWEQDGRFHPQPCKDAPPPHQTTFIECDIPESELERRHTLLQADRGRELLRETYELETQILRVVRSKASGSEAKIALCNVLLAAVGKHRREAESSALQKLHLNA